MIFFKRKRFELPIEFDFFHLLEISDHPHDLYTIARWLAKRGEILCGPRELEIFWIFFSNRTFGMDWAPPTNKNIRKFSQWNNTLPPKKEG